MSFVSKQIGNTPEALKGEQMGARFLEMTLESGAVVLVNQEQIISISPVHDEATWISLTNGKTITVQEFVDDIAAALILTKVKEA